MSAIQLSALRQAVAAVAVVGLSACAGATEPPGAELPAIHHVRIAFDSITVIGSCDHNSIFEDAVDGEFSFTAAVADTRAATLLLERSLVATLRETTAALPSTWYTVTRQDVSQNPAITVQFQATETDGLLGPDPAMKNRSTAATHRWNGMQWDGPRHAALIGSSDCGLVLRYSIRSTPIE